MITSAATVAKDVTSYRFAVRSDLGEVTQVHHLVATVTDGAILRIEHTQSEGSHPFFADSVGRTEELSKRLSTFTYQSLMGNVIALSNAKIERSFMQVVCMMMPSPVHSNNHLSVARGYDVNTGNFFGDMELVAGPRGCWVSSKVKPVGGREQLAADLLKNQIKVATLEFLNL